MAEDTEKAAVEKDLIGLDKRIPPFKNNARFLNAAKEFLSNKNIPLLCIMNEHLPIRKAAYELIRKSVNYPVNSCDARLIPNIYDLVRKNVLISIRSTRDVYEGEVVDVKIVRDEEGSPLWIDLSLRTVKATKQVTLSKNLASAISNINIGDVVYIEPNIGIVKRLGRSETRADEYDLEGDRYVQLAKGGVHTTKEKEIVLSLYDFDYAFNKYNDNISMFSRRHVDDVVSSYLQMGIARIIDSCIFVDSAHLLSKSDLAVMAQTSKMSICSNLKIVISGCNFEDDLLQCIKDYFFTVVPSSDENVAEFLEYFAKNPMNADIRRIVSEISSFSNFDFVMSILNITTDPNEFLDAYNLRVHS